MFEKIKNFFKKWFGNNDKQQIFDLIANQKADTRTLKDKNKLNIRKNK